jgi:hypothetical protein
VENLIYTTFVLRICNILSAHGGALASKVEKMGQKFKNLQIFGNFSKVFFTYSMRLLKFYKKITNFGEKFDQKT